MDRKIVIIPTYNEKENIEKIIRAVFALEGEYNILVIEDGSPDGTGNIVKSLQQEFPDRLFMIERSGKQGLGTAYITGFKWSVEKGYDYIFEMDADFSHNPADLPRLYEACSKDGADLAIGSRYCDGISVINWPIGRVIMEMKYTTFKLGFKIKEVPIIFVDRKEGTSKMSSSIFGEAFWGVLRMKFRKIRPRANR